jgi:hypothetical protein
MPFFLHIATFVHSLFKSRRQLTLENLALRQQLAMLKPLVKRPQVSPLYRLFWILFSMRGTCVESFASTSVIIILAERTCR